MPIANSDPFTVPIGFLFKKFLHEMYLEEKEK